MAVGEIMASGDLAQRLLDSSMDVIFAVDRQGRYIVWNTLAERVTGLARTAVLGRNALRLSSFFQDIAGVDSWQRALAGESGVMRERRHTVQPYGVEGIFDIFFLPLRNAADEIEGGLWLMRDVTAHKRAEMLLKRQAALLDLAHDAIIVQTADGRILLWSHGAEETYGWSASEAVGRTTSELLETDFSESLPSIHAAIQETGQWRGELRHRRRDGTVITVDSRWSAEGAGGSLIKEYLEINRDITERRRIQEEMAHLNRDLRRALEELRSSQEQVVQAEKMAALGIMAAGVAHELNNPMMGVMNYVAFAARRTCDAASAQALTKAERELNRMRGLLSNMLTFARPIDEPDQVTSVNGLVECVLELTAGEMKAAGIEVVVDLPPDLPSVLAKPSGLQQALLNILLNARDAVENSPKKRVRISAVCGDEQLSLKVSDCGAGIPAAIQGRIFDPFFTTKPAGKGTGLGLSVSRSIIAGMGGTISVFSRSGKGTTFTVSLRRAQPDHELAAPWAGG